MRVELMRPTLEDVFVEIVSGKGGGSAEAVRASIQSADAAEDGGAS